MLKNIAITLATKISIALFSLLIIALSTKSLTVSDIGAISLIMLTITFIVMLSDFAGGGAIIYLINNYKASQIITIQYLWIVLAMIPVSALLFLFPFFTVNQTMYILVIALLTGLYAVNLNILTAFGFITVFNIIQNIQIVLQFVILVIWFYTTNKPTITLYLIAYLLSIIPLLLYSFFKIKTILKNNKLQHNKIAVKLLFKIGWNTFLSNLLTKLNYRLSYYLLSMFWGKWSVGQYSTAIQINESMFMAARSMALIQYTEISRKPNMHPQIALTVLLLKLVIIINIVGNIILISIPVEFYYLIFSDAYVHLKVILIYVSVSTLFLGASIILSSYFSGNGFMNINMQASALGLATTLIFGIILINHYGIKGAAITTTLSYGTTLYWHVKVFLKKANAKAAIFIIKKSDFKELKHFIKEILEKNGKIAENL